MLDGRGITRSAARCYAGDSGGAGPVQGSSSSRLLSLTLRASACLAVRPLADGSSCPKVGAAHRAVFWLDPERPAHRQILAGGISGTAAGYPVWVVLMPSQEHQFGDLWRRPCG